MAGIEFLGLVVLTDDFDKDVADGSGEVPGLRSLQSGLEHGKQCGDFCFPFIINRQWTHRKSKPLHRLPVGFTDVYAVDEHQPAFRLTYFYIIVYLSGEQATDFMGSYGGRLKVDADMQFTTLQQAEGIIVIAVQPFGLAYAATHREPLHDDAALGMVCYSIGGYLHIG